MVFLAEFVTRPRHRVPAWYGHAQFQSVQWAACTHAGGGSEDILHVDHVSSVLLEHQPFYQEKCQHHQNTFQHYCQPEAFLPWTHLTSAKYMLSPSAFFKGAISKNHRQEYRLPPSDRKTDNSSTAVIPSDSYLP